MFSDRPPPSEILDKDILKRPHGRPASAQTPSVPADALSAPAAQKTSAPPLLSGTDKELLEKKKKEDDVEVAKKKAADDHLLKARVENCARAKQAKTTLDSGVRVSRTNEKGEREVMDEAARAAEVKRIQSVMDADCR